MSKELPEIFYKLIALTEKVSFHKEMFGEQYTKVSSELSSVRKQLTHDPDNSTLRNAKNSLLNKLGGMKVSLNDKFEIMSRFCIRDAKTHGSGFIKVESKIFYFNSQYWVHVEVHTIVNFLRLVSTAMGIEKVKANNVTVKNGFFKQFESDIITSKGKQSECINFQNGTLDTNGTLREFRAKDFLFHQLQYNYDPTAEAPIFKKVLEQILPEKDKRMVLSEYMGYLFLKEFKVEKGLFLVGGGGNGKGWFYEIMKKTLGEENICSYTLEELTDNKGYSRALIGDKLVNFSTEASIRVEANMLKTIISGEDVSARPIGEPPIILKNYARIIALGNRLPIAAEITDAYFRRFLIVMFEYKVTEAEKDIELHNKVINSELAGVFNWILEGKKRLSDNKKFSHCESAERAVEKYRHDADTVSLFITEYSIEKSESGTGLADLYIIYTAFCINSGLKKLNRTNFKNRLVEHGFVAERNMKGSRILVKSDLFHENQLIRRQ